MVNGMLEWLIVPYVVMVAVVYLAWRVTRRHTRRQIDHDYEQLCLRTGREIF
jgi:hypothetical protein